MSTLKHKYTFIPETNRVAIEGNFQLNRLLLITNVTRNQTLYTFNTERFGIEDFINDLDNQITTVVFKFDCSGMQADDVLQILIQEDHVTFEPSETFLDPVSKIRISNPENLIDTDFEYGLQTSKWETVELSNNIPSFFISDSDSILDSVESIESLSGSSNITVRTSEPHGLVQGAPIEVNGVSSRTAEGKFLINGVSSPVSFSYQAYAPQTSTGRIDNIYTTLTPGRFYSGSEIPFRKDIGITTDEGNPANINVKTNGPHGFEVGSNFYLVNSIGTKLLEYSGQTNLSSSAADGIPTVDVLNTINNDFVTDGSLTETKQMRSTYYYKFDGSRVNVENNTINWPNHQLRNNDSLLYVPSANEDHIGGLRRFDVFYVVVIDSDTISLKETPSSSVINFSSAGEYELGRAGLHLVYEVRRWEKLRNTSFKRMRTTFNRTGSGSGWDLEEIGIYGIGNKLPQNVMLFSPTGRSYGDSDARRIGYLFDTARNGDMRMPDLQITPGIYNFIEDFTRYSTETGFRTDNMGWFGSFFDIFDTRTRSSDSTTRDISERSLFVAFLDPDEEANTFFARNHGLNTDDVVDLSLGENVERPLYNFTQARFTPGGADGRFGPSLTQARNGLTGPSTQEWKNNTEYFTTSNGVQKWIVPSTGVYTIETWGAQGGHARSTSSSTNRRGGRGARMRGDFQLTKGEVLNIIVGQQGDGRQKSGFQSINERAGGGGGTFVWKDEPTPTQPLIVAGGGGAASGDPSSGQNGRDANTSTTGGRSVSNTGTAGTNGNGGISSGGAFRAGAGGGFFTNGSGGGSVKDGLAALNGGVGGSSNPSSGLRYHGGFGGGGADARLNDTSNDSEGTGGGGGYSGGAGGNSSSDDAGGGGGSFNSGTNQSNSTGARAGDGEVIITKAGDNSPIFTNNSTTSIFNSNQYSGFTVGKYFVERVSEDRFRLFFPGSSNRLAYINEGNLLFDSNSVNETKNSFYFQNHGFSTNDRVVFNTGDGGVIPTTDTARIVFESRNSGNIENAWNLITSSLEDYLEDLNNYRPIFLNGNPNSNRPINSGVVVGTSLLSNYEIDRPFLRSYFLDNFSITLPTSNDLYRNGQRSDTSKDIAIDTQLENKGWNYIGTDFVQNTLVPHYSLLWGQSDELNRDVIEFRVPHRLNASSTGFGNRSQQNISYTIEGDNSWRTSYNVRWGVSPTIVGFVELNLALWNEDFWTPVNDDPVYRPISTGRNAAFYFDPNGISFNNTFWSRPIFFRTIFMLEPGATFNATLADNLITKLVTDFAEGFKGPELTENEEVFVNVINNDRFSLRDLNNFEFNLTDTGSPIFGFKQEGVSGVSDGAYTINSIPEEDEFSLALPFQSPAGSINFKPEDINNNLIFTEDGHFLLEGARVFYNSNNQTKIPELEENSEYFVSVVDENVLGLSVSFEDAIQGEIIDLTTGAENGEIHSLSFNTIAGRISGIGEVDVTADSAKVKGVNGTLFQRYFKVGDEIFIKDNNETPGSISVFTIVAISDDSELEVNQPIGFTATGTKYFLTTKLYVRPDGYAVHRPFDGGVEMAAGTAPLSQIIRQTRKYFRYQSGKGLQTSLAINFNPPVQAETVEGFPEVRKESDSLAETEKQYSVLHEINDVFNIATVSQRSDEEISNTISLNESNPDLVLYRGQTYLFNIQADGHPFLIKTEQETGTSDLYNDGITNNGAEVGQIEWIVDANAPSTLYYSCQFHSPMTGTITIEETPEGYIPSQDIQTFNVTNDGSGAYNFNYLVRSVQVPNNDVNLVLNLYKGETYTFNINTPNDPFWIKTEPTTGSTDSFNEGVTNNGASSGSITWTISEDTPSILYYNSENSESKSGTINILDPEPSITFLASEREYNVFESGDDYRLVLKAFENPELNLYKNETYKFIVEAPGHPFWIKTSQTSGSSDAYDVGIDNNGTDDGVISWTIDSNAPSELFYNCGEHSNETGVINILENPSTAITSVRVSTKYPHRLQENAAISVSDSTDQSYNGDYDVKEIIDEDTFVYEIEGSTSTSIPGGLIKYVLNGYTGSFIRCGMFDSQNGFFFEFDGNTLFAVRRSSTEQISGTVQVTKNSNRIVGTNTNFPGQLETGDNIILRGQTYRVVKVDSRTELFIQPQYKGISASEVIVTKTVDTRVPQSGWNIDKADGKGVSGFKLNINKIQMAYMDYSWYGAGKIRFGFKDNSGHVKYFHEFRHNNLMDTAYMRSGNLPARYEIQNDKNLNYAPTLFHWGTSVIMDGTFDDDDSYLFTAQSNDLSFTNGQSNNLVTSGNSALFDVFNRSTRQRDWFVRIPFNANDANKLSSGAPLFTVNGELNGEEIDYTNFSGSTIFANIFIQTSSSQPLIFPVVSSGTEVSIGAPPQSIDSKVNLGRDLVPLITIRLAPSADQSVAGSLGSRDIINRMQLKLQEVGLILTNDCEVKLILNGNLSTVNWENVNRPSLSELIKHEAGDRVLGGIEVFSFRAPGGTTDNTGRRLSNTSNFDLKGLTDMGNSILGGDGTYPNGPDILTIAIQVVNTQGINADSPFRASSRLSWAESQS